MNDVLVSAEEVEAMTEEELRERAASFHAWAESVWAEASSVTELELSGALRRTARHLAATADARQAVGSA